MKIKFLSLMMAILMVLSLMPAATAAQTPESNPFTDVKESNFYYESVLWAVENEITKGTSATTFSPNEFCTRAQVVTFLWRAAGCPEPESTVCPFADVEADDYFYKAVLWAMENGITSGATKTEFSPDAKCTRAQIVTFLHRSIGSPKPESTENPFRDLPSGEYYSEAVLWAVENGITKGTSADTFSPKANCSRAQVVTFLYRSRN